MRLATLPGKSPGCRPSQVAALPDVPSRRTDTLPAAALVMSRVLRKLKPERVVFSICGLREGWLYAQLDRDEQYRDPLLEGAQAIGLPTARVPGFSAALARWTDQLFPGETQSDRRLRLAVCALTDMSWRDHEKVRGGGKLPPSAAVPVHRNSPIRNGLFLLSRSWPDTAATSITWSSPLPRSFSARASCGVPKFSAECCSLDIGFPRACLRSSTRCRCGSMPMRFAFRF